ncbi:MAG: hypothetical protein AAF417_07210 [Pseudomonadota bacterium]
MKPVTVITGIVLGTCFSITVSLAAVLLMFLILGDDYPRLGSEFRALIVSLTIFLVLTAISALSFYGVLTGHRLRMAGQAVMWGGLALTGYYFWP